MLVLLTHPPSQGMGVLQAPDGTKIKGGMSTAAPAPSTTGVPNCCEGGGAAAGEATVASEAELESFSALPIAERKLTPSIRGVLAEAALTGWGGHAAATAETRAMQQLLRITFMRACAQRGVACTHAVTRWAPPPL